MGKIFATGEIDYNFGTVFAITFMLTLVVFFTIEIQLAKWLLVDNYTFPFMIMIALIIGMLMLIYYGIKFVKYDQIIQIKR